MENFSLSKSISITCRSESTRYGFRHLATLYANGFEKAKSKACYYNRTWESYTFQTVLHKVIDAYFSAQLAGKYKKKVDRIALGEEKKQFTTIANIAMLGSILCEKQEDQNNFKKRILSTIPGIDFPDDFSTIPENEKQKRLDAAINVIS